MKRALLSPGIAELKQSIAGCFSPVFLCNQVSSETEKCDIVEELGCTHGLGSDEIRGSASCLPKYPYNQE